MRTNVTFLGVWFVLINSALFYSGTFFFPQDSAKFLKQKRSILKIAQCFKTPSPPWKSNFKQTSSPVSLSLQMITNQLKENIIQGWLIYVIRSFFRVGFIFSIWLSFDLLSVSWSVSICFFLALYSCVHLFTRTEHVNTWNKNINKIKSGRIQIDHAFYCSI